MAKFTVLVVMQKTFTTEITVDADSPLEAGCTAEDMAFENEASFKWSLQETGIYSYARVFHETE